MERLKKEFKELIESLIIALILALFIRSYFVQAFSIPSSSMESTLRIGDKLLANKFIYHFREPKRCEIVIFQFSGSIERREYFDLYLFKIPLPEFVIKRTSLDFRLFKMNFPEFLVYVWKDYIKRIIAVEGEVVEIKNGKVYVNSRQIIEPYIEEEPFYNWGPKTVPENHIFVLGDNRNNSEDSHIWGFLDLKYLRGKAMVKYWPPQRIGLIK